MHTLTSMGDHQNITKEIEAIIMEALSTLSTTQLSSLSHSLSTTFHHHHRRLASLLFSPNLFTHTLNHLFSLSLSQKSLLIARYLLSFLHLLIPMFPSLSASCSTRLRLCDLDSVLLLLFFCEIRQYSPKVLETSPRNWLRVLQTYCSDTILNLSGGLTPMAPAQGMGSFVDIVVKCRRFVATKGCMGGEPGKEVPTSVAFVVALPLVEVASGGGGVECVICKEEMKQGRDICELPCHHLFHWMCVLPWLKKRNTCPCCRIPLPTDDVYGEIRRLWEVIAKLGGHHFD